MNPRSERRRKYLKQKDTEEKVDSILSSEEQISELKPEIKAERTQIFADAMREVFEQPFE